MIRYKWFQHDGERTPETDAAAEALARHTMADAWPGIQDVALQWTKHNQTWLLFASGRTEEP